MNGLTNGVTSEESRKRKRDAKTTHSVPSGDKRHKTQDAAATEPSSANGDQNSKVARRNRRRKDKLNDLKKRSPKTDHTTTTRDSNSKEARRAHKELKRKLRAQKEAEEIAGAVLLEDGTHVVESHAIAGVNDAKNVDNNVPMTGDERMKDDGENHSLTSGDVRSSRPRWSISSPRGGAFLDRDPIFLKDKERQEYLVTAVGNTVQVLSVSTSLAIATLEAAAGVDVLSIDAIITNDENLVRVVYSNGMLTDWDWTQNVADESTLAANHVHTCKVAAVAGNIATVSASTATKSNQSSSQILINGIQAYECKYDIRDLQLLCGTDILIAFCDNVLIIGNKVDAERHAWTELPTQDATSFDLRYSTSGAGSKIRHRLALALGHPDGKIFYHHDIWPLLQSKQSTLSKPQILHWHRHLNAVKFSKDGNYIISGGGETTLVLWQLATGSKSFLPNLTSDILRIVVNGSGNRYALCMADNSIMVLSTSELRPVANFSGLQLRQQSVEHDLLPCTAVVHSTKKDQILLAVPASQYVHDSGIESRPFLQTYNIGTLHHVNRQALTRNNVTDFNVSPDGKVIEAPDVTDLAISFDGQWLASIDEWTPPVRDLEHATVTDDAETSTRKEVYLKIWQWNESAEHWMLNTRFDAPHARSTLAATSAGQVLQLISEPTLAGFITIGEDAMVRVWRPKKKMRHGVPLLDAQGQAEIEWHCKRETELTHDGEMDEMEVIPRAPNTASLAISEDGSLIAASISTDEDLSPAIFFINNNTDMFWSCRYNIATSALVSLSFVGRSLVVASSTMLRVWDVIDERLQSCTSIVSGVDEQTASSTFMLASNAADGSVVVVVPLIDGAQQLRIVNSQDGEVEFESVMKRPAVAVLANADRHGYTVIFADATISTLKSSTSTSEISLRVEAGHRQLATQTYMIEEAANDTISQPLDAVHGVKSDTVTSSVEDDRSVVRPEHLSEVFEAGLNSTSLPSVRDMFHAVAGLFGRKSLSKSSSL